MRTYINFLFLLTLLLTGIGICYSQTANLIPYYQDGMFGLMNRSTHKLDVPCKYNEVLWAPQATVFGVKEGKLWGLIDITGKEIMPPVYERMEIAGNGLYLVRVFNKTGLIDPTGKQLMWGVYEKLEVIPDELGGGFVTQKTVCDTYHGERCCNLYDKNGIVKPNTDFWYIGTFKYGLARAVKNKADKVGFINAEGKFKIKPVYENTDDEFANGVVKVYGNYSGYIDTLGKKIDAKAQPKAPVEDKQGYTDGFARVEQGGKYKVVNKQGKDITGYNYTIVGQFRDGLSIVKNERGNYGVINESGKEIVPSTYADINPYRTGYVQAKDYTGNWSIIGADGTVLVRFDKKFSGFLSLGNGIALTGILLGPGVGKRVYVDETGFEYFSIDAPKADGCISDDCKNGPSVYVFPVSHDRYEGNFVNGVMEDKNAKVYDITGSRIYEGGYSGGKKNGYGQYYSHNELVYKGTWLDDLRHGTGTEYDGNHTFSRREVTYDHGNYTGKVITVLVDRAGDYTVEDYSNGSKVYIGYFFYSGQQYIPQAAQSVAAPQPVQYTVNCPLCNGKGYTLEWTSKTMQETSTIDNSNIGGGRSSTTSAVTYHESKKVTCTYCNGAGSFVKTVKW